MHASEGSKENRETLFTLAHCDNGKLITLGILLRLQPLLGTREIKSTHFIEGTEDRIFVTLLLAMHDKHQTIHARVITTIEISGPTHGRIRKPRLFPILLNRFDFLNHCFSKQIKSLFLCTLR